MSLSSFSQFIKLAISLSDRNRKNLWIKSGESKEELVWHDFRCHMINWYNHRDLEGR